MINPMIIESKVIQIMDGAESVSVDDLSVSELSLFELINLITFQNDFEKIEITNLNLDDHRFFNDATYVNVPCPYFEVKRKVA